MKKILVLVASALFATASNGTDQTTIQTTITKVYTYTQFGGGDVLVVVENPATNCADGFWLSPADAGFKSTLSSLLVAQQAHSKVQITAIDTQLWPGSSSGAFCKIKAAVVTA